MWQVVLLLMTVLVGFGILPVLVFYIMKLGTAGYFSAKKNFESTHNQKDEI